MPASRQDPEARELPSDDSKATSPAPVRLTVECESIREDADRFAVRRKGTATECFPYTVIQCLPNQWEVSIVPEEVAVLERASEPRTE
jgi:hypothetical protein